MEQSIRKSKRPITAIGSSDDYNEIKDAVNPGGPGVELSDAADNFIITAGAFYDPDDTYILNDEESQLDYPLAANGPVGEHMTFIFDEDGDMGMARNLYYNGDTDTFIKCKCGNHLICVVDLTSE